MKNNIANSRRASILAGQQQLAAPAPDGSGDRIGHEAEDARQHEAGADIGIADIECHRQALPHGLERDQHLVRAGPRCLQRRQSAGDMVAQIADV